MSFSNVLGDLEVGAGVASAFIPGMQGFAAPLVAGGVSTLGQQATNVANAQQAQNQMNFQQASQQESERYNTQMSDTQWQRGVADMTAAGLNPALAYQQGGASAPTVSSMSGSQARMDNAAGAGISSAQSVAAMQQSVAQAQKTRAETNLIDSTTASNIADSEARARLTSAQASSTTQQQGQSAAAFPLQQQLLQARWLNDMASAAQTRQATTNLGLTGDLLKLQQAPAQAESDFASSQFGHYLFPYLNSAGAVGGALNTWGKGLDLLDRIDPW